VDGYDVDVGDNIWEISGGVYETTVQAPAVDPEFRVMILSRYNQRCPVPGVGHPGLLDGANVLP